MFKQTETSQDGARDSLNTILICQSHLVISENFNFGLDLNGFSVFDKLSFGIFCCLLMYSLMTTALLSSDVIRCFKDF